MVSNLKDHTSWGMIRSMERASERVNSWPEWKKVAFTLSRPKSNESPKVRVSSTQTDSNKQDSD